MTKKTEKKKCTKQWKTKSHNVAIRIIANAEIHLCNSTKHMNILRIGKIVCIATVEYDYVKLKQKPLNHTFFGEYLFGLGPNQKQY